LQRSMHMGEMNEEEMDYRSQQIEALQTMVEYNEKLMKGIKTSAEEFGGERKPDTDEFFKQVIDGINWMISVLNACLPLINEKETLIDKEAANDVIKKLVAAIQSGDDAAKSQVLTDDMLPLVSKITEAAQVTIQ